MKFYLVMERVLLIISSILCTVLFLKTLYKLRLSLVWRVNCWFCNSNFWIKFVERNCWTCPKCEQYNGFTEDGDYNKKIHISNDNEEKNAYVFQKSPQKNGLCKMCNINQQLKVAQLANFVPMNESKYDEEIECYRMQLENAYRLCSPCKVVVQTKLHKEKEKLLDIKLLETRTPERKANVKIDTCQKVTNVMNCSSIFIAGLLLLLVSMECYDNAIKRESIFKTLENIKEIFNSLAKRIFTILKMKMFITFPSLQYLDGFGNMDIDGFICFNSDYNEIIQKSLGGFVCVLQLVKHIFNLNKGYSIVIDFLWTVFVIIVTLHKYVIVDKLIISFMKLISVIIIMVIYKNTTTEGMNKKQHTTPKKLIRNNFKPTFKKVVDEEDSISLDTDDDVSLSKFGLHNLTDSSCDASTTLNNSMLCGRSFIPKNNILWNKSSHNTSFSANSINTQSPNSLKNSIFVKPSFKKYQKLIDDSDSDLDESISSLCISSPKKIPSKTNPVFALRKFTASPNFIVPLPMDRSRPLISPSKLGHSTSWVAGGYWGVDGDSPKLNMNGSRSSSQSSGFESQTSSYQRNLFSQPPSREQSVCPEPDKTLIMQERYQHYNMNNCNNCNPSSLLPGNTVFPQMQYNGHVQIPQPRFAQQTFVTQNVFSQQPFSSNIFKAPSGSRLIKLPQDSNTFMSH